MCIQDPEGSVGNVGLLPQNCNLCIESMCNIMDIMNKPVQCQFKATRRTSRRTFQIVLLRTLKESTTQTVKSFKKCWICTVLVFEPLPFPWGSAGLFLLSKLDLPQPRATWSAAKCLKSPITLRNSLIRYAWLQLQSVKRVSSEWNTLISKGPGACHQTGNGIQEINMPMHTQACTGKLNCIDVFDTHTIGHVSGIQGHTYTRQEGGL